MGKNLQQSKISRKSWAKSKIFVGFSMGFSRLFLEIFETNRSWVVPNWLAGSINESILPNSYPKQIRAPILDQGI